MQIANIMFTQVPTTEFTFFTCTVKVRSLFVLLISVNIIGAIAVITAKADEGFIRGSLNTAIHGLDGKIEKEKLEFVLACDQDCCLVGSYSTPRDETEPIEQFTIANRDNQFGILVTVKRREGRELTTEGEWSTQYIQELRKLKLEDSFESRYNVVESGASSWIALPIYLSWNVVGVSRDDMKSALQGKNLNSNTDLGSLEIRGSHGIERMLLKKSSSNLFSPGGPRLAELSGDFFPNGLISITEEYTFSPERRFDSNEPFRCLGSVTETVADGRTRKTNMDIHVVEIKDTKSARVFINALLRKLPNNQKIITDSGIDVATVLDNGKQKVAIDRDVERLGSTQFSNSGQWLYYYVTPVLLLAILGLIGYLRWSRKAS